MNKKFKYTSLVAAGAVTLGLVGGTLAWFTSTDSVTNKFNTLGNSYDDDKPNAGIKIQEDWDYKGDGKSAPVTPGSTVNKDVQVRNDVDYPQFIKVSFTKQFVDASSEEKTFVEDEKYVDKDNDQNNGKFPLDTSLIELNPVTAHVENLPDLNEQKELTLKLGTWYQYEGEYYYYGKVAPKGTKDGEKDIDYTNTLLDSVTLSPAADNHYQNLDFQVIVNADSVQASNKAASSVWFSSEGVTDSNKQQILLALQEAFEKLESEGNTAPVDNPEPINGANDNHTHVSSTK